MLAEIGADERAAHHDFKPTRAGGFEGTDDEA